MNLDYLTANSLSKYPFNDNMSLCDTVMSRYLREDCIVDLLLVDKVGTLKQAYLKQYKNDSSFIWLYFGLIDSLGAEDEILLKISCAVLPTAKNQMFSTSNAKCALKVVVGQGMHADAIVGNFDCRYKITRAKIADDAIILMVPRVTSIAFHNSSTTDKNEFNPTPTVKFIGNEVIAFTGTILTGTNVGFKDVSGSLNADVIAGYGDGLYNGCADKPVGLSTINGTGPDTYGNFLLVTDDCYTTTPLAHGLSIANICKPRCTAEQLKSFAHYNNRIRNGMARVEGLASDIYDELHAEISHYISTVEPYAYIPSYRIRSVASHVSSTVDYVSVAIGLFNPTETTVTATVTVTGGTEVANSCLYTSGNNSIPATSSITSVNIPHKGFVVYYVTRSVSHGGSISVNGTLFYTTIPEGAQTLNFSTTTR